MSLPTASVIIPTYYRSDLLKEAITSAQQQTYADIEIIVVDDSGERYAEEIVEDIDNVEYLGLDENVGANGARTRGFYHSTGEYIQFLDDDDRLRERKIERQVELLEQDQEIGVIYCGITTDGQSHLPHRGKSGDVLEEALIFDLWPCMTSTMLINRELLTEIIPLADRPGGDDLGLMIERAQRTRFDFVDEALVYKRQSTESRGNSIGAITGRKQITQEYSELYHRYPVELKDKALSETYKLEGVFRVRQSFWSFGAIWAFIKSFYLSGYDSVGIARILISLFGRPGWRLAVWVQNNAKRF